MTDSIDTVGANELVSKLLDNASSAIFVCDAATYELLYINARASQMCQKPASFSGSQTCYAHIKNAAAPCPDCPFKSIEGDGFAEKEYTDPASGKHYMARCKHIQLFGRNASVMYLTDETDQINNQRRMYSLVDGIPGGVGIYYYYPEENRLEESYLNNGYYSLLGTTREKREKYTGFESINVIHPGDVEKLMAEVAGAVRENRIANTDVRVLTESGLYKWLNIQANIESRADNRYVLFMTFADVDNEKRALLKLEESNHIINIATDHGKISIWQYDFESRQVTFENMAKSLLGYPIELYNVPDSMLQAHQVFPEDAPQFSKMYEQLFGGASSCECTVRLLNAKSGQYEWQRLSYKRVFDGDNGKRRAIGIAMNVNLQQEARSRYMHELRLRRELLKDSVASCKLNLTRDEIDEYQSLYPAMHGLMNGQNATDAIRAEILNNVAEQDWDAALGTLLPEALLAAYGRGETSVDIVYRRFIPDIGIRWVKSIAMILREPTEEEIIAFLYMRDVDSEWNDQLALESILSEEIESVIILNVKTGLAHLVRTSAGFSATSSNEPFNYDDYITEMIYSRVHPKDRAMCKANFHLHQIVRLLELESSASVAYRITTREGSILRKRAQGHYLDERQENIVISTRDITSAYDDEQRQKQVLQDAVDSANDANRAKSEFLSRMSHDMRTPLTAILALSGKELNQDGTITSKENNMDKVHASGEYLLGLINDVLDMSKIESKKMVLNLAPYSLREFEQTIDTVIGEQCRQKGIEFNFAITGDVLPWALLDKVRFDQIFINLLSNAVKFTPSGGTIDFTGQVKHEMGAVAARAKFIIRDTGIGMTRDFLPHAFDSFSQERQKGSAENNQGTGLGLSIVKQIVTLMDGDISVESELGKGSTFTVDINIKAAQPPEDAEAAPADLSRLAGAHILLCEDHPLNAQIITQLLEMKDCMVDRADNGKRGVEMYESSAQGYYDLVLMDIRMPVMNGLEAAKAIRSLLRSDAATVPIVALTADAFIEDEQSSHKAGMNGHLSKPIDTKQLYETVAKLIE